MATALATIGNLLPATIFRFDEQVAPLPRAEAVDGRFFTGGGTSFDAVVEHALRKRPATRDILILTDGEDRLNDELVAAAKKALPPGFAVEQNRIVKR